jgi:ABC-type sugar transport system permease subunit
VRSRSNTREWFTAAGLLAPAFGILGVFGVAPIVYAGYLSLYRYRHGAATFAGLDNYRRAAGDADFWASLEVTAFYTAMVVPVTILLSLGLAMLLRPIGCGRGLLRSAFFLPYVTSVVAAATVWRVLLNPQFGLANALLEAVGLPAQNWILEPRGVLHILSGERIPIDWGPSLSLCCIVVFEIWHSAGFMIVVLIAALSGVPRELEDAARIDGAGRWRTAWHVTIPMLTPTLFLLGVIGIVGAFQAFNSFYALTGGVPDQTTRNLTMYIYAVFYENLQIGYGAAMAALLALTIGGLTLAQWRLLGRRVYYES